MELVIILLVMVMLFGATRLADLGGSLGKGIKEFRQNIKDDEPATPPPAPVVVVAPPSAAPMATVSNGGPDVVAAVKCPSCSSLNPVGARHCNQCGASIATPVS